MEKFRKAGFSLVEVLVSIVVLAIGVIGAAGMQIAALRTSQQGAFQTVALQLATEMAEAVRASERGLATSGEENPYLGMDYRFASDGEPMMSRLCYAHTCNAKEFAEFEIYEWKKRVRDVLPDGRVLICRDSSPWNTASQALSWNCTDDPAGNAPIVVKLGWQGKNPDGSLVRDGNSLFLPSVALAVGSESK